MKKTIKYKTNRESKTNYNTGYKNLAQFVSIWDINVVRGGRAVLSK